MRIALITAPYNLGHEGVGVGAGPDRLLDEGAAETLEEAGHEVQVVRVEPQADSTNEIGAAFEIVRRVSEAVARAVENGAFPICSSSSVDGTNPDPPTNPFPPSPKAIPKPTT